MRDGFDHRIEGRLSSEGTITKGQPVEHKAEGFIYGEEEEEFLDNSFLEEPATSSTSRSTLLPERVENPFLSPPSRESTAGACVGPVGLPLDGWQCDFPGCSIVFQRRCDRNRHQKYHFKKWECREPSCRDKNKAFSLEKDLRRHQLSHGGERCFCPNHGCPLGAGEKAKGFSRKDNWRRHLKRCIPVSS